MPTISNTVYSRHILNKPRHESVFFILRISSGIPYITLLGTVKLVESEASIPLGDDNATHSYHILMFGRNMLRSYSRVNRSFFWDLMTLGYECSMFL
jgi:hypothetical protein